MREADREGPAEGASLRDPVHQGRAGSAFAVTPGPPGDPDRTGQRSRGWSRGRLAGWLYGWAVAVYGLDRLTKFLAETQ